MKRDLCDIVYLDVLNEKEDDPEAIEKVAIYIKESVSNLNAGKDLRKSLY